MASSELFALAAALAFAGACSGPGKYVWVDEYNAAGEGDAPYVIAPGDIIQIRVFNQDQVSTRARVRADGKISMPLLNDVTAAGLTPVALARDLSQRLVGFIKEPLVTVSFEEGAPASVYVTGEVTKPGVYPLDKTAGVLPALISAGGLTKEASNDCIFVLRQGPPVARIRFNYEALVRPGGKATAFRLRPGDIIVVE
jgi:polysaccharide export outer membrane protein